MQPEHKDAAKLLREGATVHRIADRLVKQHENSDFILWRSRCAVILGLVCGISLRDAKAVISEFAI